MSNNTTVRPFEIVNTTQVVEPTNDGTGWDFERIVRVKNGVYPTQMFRISIRRTNSKFSVNHAEISKWSDERGWNVFFVAGQDAPYMAFDPTARRMVRGVEVDIDFTPFYETADELLAIAESYFGFGNF